MKRLFYIFSEKIFDVDDKLVYSYEKFGFYLTLKGVFQLIGHVRIDQITSYII